MMKTTMSLLRYSPFVQRSFKFGSPEHCQRYRVGLPKNTVTPQMIDAFKEMAKKQAETPVKSLTSESCRQLPEGSSSNEALPFNPNAVNEGCREQPFDGEPMRLPESVVNTVFNQNPNSPDESSRSGSSQNAGQSKTNSNENSSSTRKRTDKIMSALLGGVTGLGFIDVYQKQQETREKLNSMIEEEKLARIFIEGRDLIMQQEGIERSKLPTVEDFDMSMYFEASYSSENQAVEYNKF